MLATSRTIFLTFLLLLAGAAIAQAPNGAYLDGGASKAAVILAHGQGSTPTSHVVEPLRQGIHKELGMHTLSLQMPVIPGKRSNDSFQEYATTFPEAHATITQAIDFLKSKGVERIYLMGYSMGGRMTSAFLSENPGSGIAGFIGVGLMGGGQPPLNTNVNLRKVSIPVIDIYAENDNDAKFAEFRKPLISPKYVQIPIAGARHDYSCCEKEVVGHVTHWLREQETRRNP